MGILSKLKSLFSGTPTAPSYVIYERASLEDPEKVARQYAKLDKYVSDFAWTHGWTEVENDPTLMFKVWSYGHFNIRIGTGGRTWGSLYGFSLFVTDMRVWFSATDRERETGFFKDSNINFGGWTYDLIDDNELSKTKDKLELLQASMTKEN